MTRRGWLLFVVMCVLWGSPYLLIKVAVADLSPALVVSARTGLAAAVMVPLAARRGMLAAVRRRWRVLLAFSAIEIAGPWFLLTQAEQRLSGSLAGLLIAAVPILAT